MPFTIPNLKLGTSGVSAGTYGDATHVAQVTVDTSGVVTAASSVAITGGGGGGTGLLAVAQYAPATLAQYTVSNTAGLTALDTTNLTISFTVPASTNVIVRFSATMSAPTSGNLGLGLLNHSGGAQVGDTLDNILSAQSAAFVYRLEGEWYLTGLSAGTLGLDIAGGVSVGSAKVFAMGHTGAVNDSKVGPAVITVWSA